MKRLIEKAARSFPLRRGTAALAVGILGLVAGGAKAMHVGPDPFSFLLEPPAIQEPTALALDRGKNRIYVADGKSGGILALQARPPKMEYQKEPFALKGPGGSAFSLGRIQALAASQGKLVAADAGARKLYEFYSTGRFLKALAAPGGFQPPFALAADPKDDGTFWLADASRLYRFGPGGLAASVPYAKYNLVKTAQPSGMALSPKGEVWVTDAQSGQFLRFSSDLKMMEARPAFGLKGASALLFPDPELREVFVATKAQGVLARSLVTSQSPHYLDPSVIAATLVGSERMGMATDAQDRLLILQGGHTPRLFAFRLSYLHDADQDGISDGEETNIHKTDPLRADTDGDGLSDREELFKTSTSPIKADTDGDGLSDAQELRSRPATNPLSPNDPLPPWATWGIALGSALVAALLLLAVPKIRKGAASPGASLLGAGLLGAGVALISSATASRLPQAWILPLAAAAVLAGLAGFFGASVILRRGRSARTG